MAVNPKGYIFAACLLLATTADAAPIDLDFGRFVISVSDSPTAQVFHIVDMLADWDQYSHKQYGRWAAKTLNLDQDDRQLLQKHGEMRRARGWGKGFEQAFLVDDSIEMAASKAVDAKLLSVEEATAEKAILLHFAPKISALLDQQRGNLDAFKSRLLAEQGKIKPIIEKLAAFAEAKETITVPVFLVANPEEGSGGGEANGGRLVVEVPGPDPMGVLLHESLHALLRPRSGEIGAAAESAGLSFTALNEAIAYAMAPGLTDDSKEKDRLVQQLARYLVRGTPASDNYVQSYMVAGLIRPLLRSALENGETLSTFLPKAVTQWRSFNGR